MLEIKSVIKYKIPFYGNKHTTPYGKIEVSDGQSTKIVKFDNWSFTFNRKRYNLALNGNLYSAKLYIVEGN